MHLSDFKSLIASMPTAHQSFTSKRSTWASFLNGNDCAGKALQSIFGDSNTVCISRSDLRLLAKEPQLERFIMATVIWGYPQGMRGNHVANFIRHLDMLTQVLSSSRAQAVSDWSAHFRKVDPIQGIGLSTYTKFLCFLDVRVCGNVSLILDATIIRVARRGVFAELEPLRQLSSYTAAGSYPRYLACIHKVANDLAVPAENTEFFLFEFGLNLKQPSGQPR